MFGLLLCTNPPAVVLVEAGLFREAIMIQNFHGTSKIHSTADGSSGKDTGLGKCPVTPVTNPGLTL